MNDEHIDFDDWLAEQMQDENFRAEYQRLGGGLNALRVDQKEATMNDCAEYIDRVIAEFQEKKSDLTAEELEERTAKEMAQEFVRGF